MTVDECAAFLRFTETNDRPARAARLWLKRKSVPTFKRDHHVLVYRKDVIDALASERKAS